ncbi:endonuclease MutS2 [Halobacillus andaensis]|uniref:Endonuclease MutS2 n=1 Tax=Halobacillus andaensis TaxID=1176239 RepID=A0A917B465_HALAA|nr:endonuclease MutS2 [Halobacillus andaensis]MBP2004815.1 dsDNA-specific endonuclease/ATPase MutS2 [Halobacillus andaensis]GGF18678.1 endonuclease MutS2 [Halobacillus andaensis]
MNKQAIHKLGFDQIVKEISSYALTNKGKQTIQALEPMTERRRIERSFQEIKEAVAILNINSSVPIYSLDSVTRSLEEGEKGRYIRVEALSRMIDFLDHCRKLKRFMDDKGYAAPTISVYVDSMEDLTELEEELRRCLKNGQIDDYASKALLKLRRDLQQEQTKLRNRAQELLKKRSSVLQEQMIVEKNGRLTLPVKREHRQKVKGSVMDQSSSGATLFIEPAELADRQAAIEQLKLSEQHEVEQIMYYLTGLVLEHKPAIQLAVDVMHQYDVIFAKGKYAMEIDARPPHLNEENFISLIDARHPQLGKEAVPLTITMKEEDQALMITGPNTGGKTVTLKTTGLLTMMAQAGLWIPASGESNVMIYDEIFCDIGDGQSIEANLSTFSSRLVNIIEILRKAGPHTLALIDEIGSGTEPNEGMGLAQAILEKLVEKKAKLMVTTHFTEMKELANKRNDFINGSMSFDLETLQPTYRLVIGEAGESQAFQIALKLGLHPSIIERAHEVTYQQKESYQVDEALLKSNEMKQQIIVNRYVKKKPAAPKESAVTHFNMGDNVKVKATGETAIVYKGPDENGDYIVQQKGEKLKINHKRLELYIRAEELYPADYDFDIIFKSKEYRKVTKQLDRKHIEGLTIEEEEI